MSSKFPILSFLSIVIRLFGLLLVFVGLYYVFGKGLVIPRGYSFGQSNAIALVGGMLALFFGIISSIVGESIGVLLAIEANTRHTSAHTS